MTDPPLGWRIWPLKKVLSSEARKTKAGAHSLGWPTLYCVVCSLSMIFRSAETTTNNQKSRQDKEKVADKRLYRQKCSITNHDRLTFIGTSVPNFDKISSGILAGIRGVRMGPGATPLTRIFLAWSCVSLIDWTKITMKKHTAWIGVTVCSLMT